MDKVLGLLENGDWLDIKDVAEESDLSEFETEKILDFLSRFNFIDLDEKRKRAKVNPSMLKFLKSISQIDKGQDPAQGPIRPFSLR